MTTSERSARGSSGRIERSTAFPLRRSTSDDPARPGVETIEFDSRGVRCEADLYLPDDEDPLWPAVVMAHVFGAERGWGLAPFAERFARAGFAVLVFDYRHLGGSSGTPRRLIDPSRQLDDWAAALSHVRSLDAVDGDRVALWGTSFSGGHALATASRDPEVRAVVAQVPYVDGRATTVHQTRGRSWLSNVRLSALALADRAFAVAGLGPVEVSFVSEPGGDGLVDSPGAKSGFTALVPDGVELVNRTPARVVFDLPFHRPGRETDGIGVPVHVVVAEADRLLPPEPTERLIDRLAEPSVHRVPAPHFEVHRDPWFEPIVDRQVAFLTEALSDDPGRDDP